MLVAEGYLEARPKSGFFVLEYTDALPQPSSAAPPVRDAENEEDEAGSRYSTPAPTTICSGEHTTPR